MKIGAMVAIERIGGVTLYGRILDSKGRLGQFEVHSDHLGNNSHVYLRISEAKTRMNALIGVYRK